MATFIFGSPREFFVGRYKYKIKIDNVQAIASKSNKPRHPIYGKIMRAGEDVSKAPDVPNISMAEASCGC